MWIFYRTPSRGPDWNQIIPSRSGKLAGLGPWNRFLWFQTPYNGWILTYNRYFSLVIVICLVRVPKPIIALAHVPLEGQRFWRVSPGHTAGSVAKSVQSPKKAIWWGMNLRPDDFLPFFMMVPTWPLAQIAATCKSHSQASTFHNRVWKQVVSHMVYLRVWRH